MTDKDPPFNAGDKIVLAKDPTPGQTGIVLGVFWSEQWYVAYTIGNSTQPHVSKAQRFNLKPWEPKVGDIVSHPGGSKAEVKAVEFHPDGRLFAWVFVPAEKSGPGFFTTYWASDLKKI